VTDIFKTIEWTVNSLIARVEDGTIQLPDLQRPFVWPAAKVRDLFDSMYRGYPVGELMFWDVPAEGETKPINKDAPLGASHQIVDGQQRLTSLYAAIKGQPVRDENYRNRDIRIGFNPFTEKFEVRTPAIAKSSQWVEDISTTFDSPLKAQKAFMKRYHESGLELSDDEEERIGEVFIRLTDLLKYQFEIVHIQKDVTKATVADIFVRINSEGVSLKAYDYILTWLSVFWPEGREDIEEFARNSRVSPEVASHLTGSKITWTAHNPFVNVETGHLVRAVVAIGQNRAKLTDAYAALQAKERATGYIDPEKQRVELDKLKSALPIVTNRLHWQEFIHSIKIAGFTDRRGITSTTNLISTYILFLLGRTRFNVKLEKLRPLIARWFFMSQLTSRYTGSGETQLQKDLDRLGDIGGKDANGFVRALDDAIANELTADFWTYRIPDSLVTSSQALSPSYQCYLAALNILGAELFMIHMPVSQWMNPSMPAIKGMEAHHLFPRKYQEKVLGTTDLKRINQAANFAPTDWDTNIFISDRPPAEYWADLVKQRAGGDEEWLAAQRYWHALPADWEQLDYDQSLVRRRKLIAQVVRDGFEKIGSYAASVAGAPVDEVIVIEEILPMQEWTIAALIDAGVIRVGDNLDPVDGAPQDAAVTEDATLRLTDEKGRTEEFDSLDAAARYLGFPNAVGLDFWVLDDNPDVTLGELLARATASAA
jgi:hypothetical protein